MQQAEDRFIGRGASELSKVLAVCSVGQQTIRRRVRLQRAGGGPGIDQIRSDGPQGQEPSELGNVLGDLRGSPVLWRISSERFEMGSQRGHRIAILVLHSDISPQTPRPWALIPWRPLGQVLSAWRPSVRGPCGPLGRQSAYRRSWSPRSVSGAESSRRPGRSLSPLYSNPCSNAVLRDHTGTARIDEVSCTRGY